MSIFSRNELPFVSEETKIAIVISRFNEEITERLLDSCLKTLKKCGVLPEQIEIIWVPGAFEIPLVAQKVALNHDINAIITLGAVIRGETPHFDYVCEQTAKGILDTQLKTGLPIIFGVLTCDTPEQAFARAGRDKENKGYQTAIAALEMINIMQAIN